MMAWRESCPTSLLSVTRLITWNNWHQNRRQP